MTDPYDTAEAIQIQPIGRVYYSLDTPVHGGVVYYRHDVVVKKSSIVDELESLKRQGYGLNYNRGINAAIRIIQR